jgi:glyoxylase-like metal-dependent hydrolase (beta-lactamase superfamily II)
VQPIEIMDDLFFIQRGYLNGNHFAFRSDEPVLIDTGYASDFLVTERLLRDLGIDLPRTRLIVNTHCHCDHIGGNKVIQERSQCAVAMHEIGKHFIDTRNDWATWWKYFDQEADFFECSIGLKDGDRVTVGPHDFDVIHTPGHASDGIVLYNSKFKVLLSSDTLWEHDMAVMNIRVEGSAACFRMLESLRRLETLDVEMVYPGHGKPFADILPAIAKTRKRLESFIGDEKKIGNDLMKKIIVYTLMMKTEVDEASFFELLMKTPWFRETADLYFDGDYSGKYDSIMKGLLGRGIVKCRQSRLFTTVKP